MALSTYVKELFGRLAIQAINSSGVDVGIVVEDSGTPKVVAYGKDSGGNEDPLRTNASQQLQVEIVGALSSPYVNLVGVDVPSSEGVLLDGSASLTAAGIYAVEFYVVSIDSSNSVDVTIGRDDAAGGSLAGAEYWMFAETLPAGGTSGWRGPFIMSGDDDVRGVATAANDAVIHFRVRRTDA